MISLTKLRAGLRDDWVVFESGGSLLYSEPPADVGPAVMLVTEVVDAMKVVESGFVVESVDRDRLWVLEGLAMSGEVISQLGEGEVELADLIEAVRESGFEWQVTPTYGRATPST